MSDEFTYKTRGFFGRIPSEPHELTDRITPTRACIVLCHLGVLDAQAVEDWKLEIGGLVKTGLVLSLRELKSLPKRQFVSVHQCAGSPLAPDKPTRRVCNVSWAGVRLGDLLGMAGVDETARFVWSHGADSGEFGGIECGHYLKDLPLSRVGSDVLVAYEMNGAELIAENGFPLRLVVPGYYGTNSVKWLRKIELRSERAPSVFTTRWYNDLEADGSSRPVWGIAPQSIIVWPKPDSQLNRGGLVQVWGWAWGDANLMAVELSADEGATWQECRLERAAEWSWSKFVYDLFVPEGCTGLLSRARSRSGELQPVTGRRNAIYRVPISVL
ncbi:Mo-co oxidoreductase dimerisation domain-containing protein [Bradyrhizobium sp. Rc3b]|uniref:molybdopterin-dependent oxidoreductase n=1 Tax=Bradyrhizobium sp. Rc3b TaxID=1855322 RepID=UPI0008EDD7F7|nr:molybdopterin-dependent oxidoreductase [Bradyrhizobium sp. Rc3b]SFN78293.1 Mo-co oxidoreductase dimerisation domain-containing protein [Bradyrhizobium sp. Rc3b]